MSKDIRLGKLRKSGTERKTLIHPRLNEVHHLRKVTTSPFGDFLVDGVAQVNLLSPAQEKAGEEPLVWAYLVSKAWWWTQIQKMARLCDTPQFSLLQALHHGHLKDRGTNSPDSTHTHMQGGLWVNAHLSMHFWNVCKPQRTTSASWVLNCILCPWSHWWFAAASQICQNWNVVLRKLEDSIDRTTLKVLS